MTRTIVVALAFALVATAAPRARASSHCHEVSNVVGYEHCRRFAWWSHQWPVIWELGAVTMRYTAPASLAGGAPAHVATGTGEPAQAAPALATGVRMRELYGIGRFLYLGTEVDVAWFDDAHLVSDGKPVTSGSIGQMTGVVGIHNGIGPLMFGEELAPGGREMYGPTPTMALPANRRPPPLDTAFVLDVHETVDVWLSPFVSLGLEGGVDLMNTRDVHVGASLALHFAPFDNTR